MSISVIEAIVIAKDNSDKDGATALLYLMKYGYLEPRQQGSSALLHPIVLHGASRTEPIRPQ